MSEFLNSDIRNQHNQLDNNNYFEKLNCKKIFFQNPEGEYRGPKSGGKFKANEPSGFVVHMSLIITV